MEKVDKKRLYSFAFVISFAYSAGYVARTVLSGIMPRLEAENIFELADLGYMGSAFLLMYGIGQLINGIIGDYINPKFMIFTGLTGAGFITYFFPFIKNPVYLILLWGFCGFLCSMLWGPMSKIVSENSNNNLARKLMLVLTGSSIVGSMISYIICALIGFWQLAFYLSGIYIIIASLFWLILMTKFENKGQIVYKIEKTTFKRNKKLKEKHDYSFYLQMAIIPATISIMLNSVIRNAASYWIPTYIAQAFNISESFSATIVIILPVVNLLGAIGAFRILKYFKDDEHKLSSLLFLFAALMFVVMLIWPNVPAIAISAIFLAAASMAGVHNLLLAVYTLRFANTNKTSAVAGFLDSAAYLAAGVANIFIGLWIEEFSWIFVIGFWCIITALGFIASMVSSKISTRQQ